MKQTQYVSDLRTLNAEELDQRLRDVRTELFNLRFQVATGQLENHRQIRRVRRQIAEVLTVKRGRELGMEQYAPEVAQAAPVAAPAAAVDEEQA